MNAEDEQVRSYERKPRSKKCPICWELVYMSETRPVRFYEGQEGSPPQEGSDVVLRLIQRSSGSALPLPRDGADALLPGEDVPWYFAAEVMDYARIMKGTEEYIIGQFDQDIAAVKEQEKQNELMFGDDTLEWTRKAIQLLNEAKEKIKGIGGPMIDPMSPRQAKRKLNSTEAVSLENTGAEAKPDTKAPHNDPRPGGVSTASLTTEYHFYQALPHYYLSPLDVRILREAFGPYTSFPATILPRVERVSTGHVFDEELRKRSKWLGHVPLGCEVCFLECDWTDTVPPETLEIFKPDIEKRRRLNREKEARDERARARAEKEEDDERYSHLRRRIPEETPQTWFREDEFQPLGSNESEKVDLEVASSSPPWGSRSQESPFTSLANMSTSPSTSRTVWGTPAIGGSSPALGGAPEVAPNATNDGWLQDWDKDLQEELLEQARNLSLGDAKKPTATGGKKKKPKKITLMSTTVRRQA
jgi:hypothetical protein